MSKKRRTHPQPLAPPEGVPEGGSGQAKGKGFEERLPTSLADGPIPDPQKWNPAKYGQVGKGHYSSRDNKILCCMVCGYRFLYQWQNLWLMQLHFVYWHDTLEVQLLTVSRNSVPDVPEPITMADQDEMTRQLQALRSTIEESRTVSAEAHSALKGLKQGLKEYEVTIKRMIEDEVTKQVGAIAGVTRGRMNHAADEIVERVSTDLSARLGLR